MVNTLRDTGVGVLDKGMAIVDLCEHSPSTATEVARQLGMSIATAHRLAAALVVHGLLERTLDGRFHLGPRFLTTRLVEFAMPVLQNLTSQIHESLTLWVPRGDLRVCGAWIPAEGYLRVAFPVGTSFPLADGGSAAEVLQGRIGPEGWSETVESRTVGLGSVSAPVDVRGTCVAAVCVVVPASRVTSSPGRMYGDAAVQCATEISLLVDS